MSRNKKREVRKSVQQPGWITLEGGFAARHVWCRTCLPRARRSRSTMRNVLPARLRLAFSRDARTGRNCEVVWRRGASAGIKFVR